MAEIQPIQVHGTAAAGATTEDVVSIDIAEDSEIVGIHCRIHATLMGTDDTCEAELSFLSSAQFTTNDARGLIGAITVQTSNSTAEFGNAQETEFIGLPDGIPVSAGERIHMHLRSIGTGVPIGRFTLYMKQRAASRRARRRR